jgi:DNA-binding GntR family transcriptional regulator
MHSRTKTTYDYLYDRIINNHMKPGSAIVEQDVSKLLGVSRTPVREALKKLESLGLVEHIPAKGTYVSEISLQDINDIFSLREVLEETALRNGIKDVPDKELDELEKKFLLIDEKSSSEDYFILDKKLHNLIINHGRNRHIVNVVNNLIVQIEHYRRISTITPVRYIKSCHEHIEIVRAMKNRDLERAVEALRLHIRNSKDGAINICQEYVKEDGM